MQKIPIKDMDLKIILGVTCVIYERGKRPSISHLNLKMPNTAIVHHVQVAEKRNDIFFPS